jgi:hypothetical protein
MDADQIKKSKMPTNILMCPFMCTGAFRKPTTEGRLTAASFHFRVDDLVVTP